MALIDELAQLRDKTLASLDASHDYFAHTAYAWRLVQQVVREGSEFTTRNQVTGSTIDQSELSGRAQEYVTVYSTSATFQHFVSLFENFVVGFFRAWLTAYPKRLENKQVQFGTILEATDKEQIVAAVVEKKAHDLGYQRLADCLAELKNMAGLDCPKQSQIDQLAEIKASRDVLVHNNGIANAVYAEKSGARARCKDGDALELPEPYHRESWQLIKQVVSDIAAAGIREART